MDLIPPALAGFWPGHSSRHFLVRVAAAIGVGKDDRDDVGRWGIARKTEAHGSTDYVLSVKQTVLATQEKVCRSLCMGDPSYCEDEVLEKLKQGCAGRGINSMHIHKLHTVLKKDPKGNISSDRTSRCSSSTPTMDLTCR